MITLLNYYLSILTGYSSPIVVFLHWFVPFFVPNSLLVHDSYQIINDDIIMTSLALMIVILLFPYLPYGKEP